MSDHLTCSGVSPTCGCDRCIHERIRAVIDAWTPRQRAIAYVQLYALGLRIDTAMREASK